jgi:hypothetical protein
MTFIEDGVEYIDINEFATLTERTVQGVRDAITSGNRVRKLKAIKVRRRYYVKKSEYHIYPYINSGKGTDKVYHFPGPTLCAACTAGERCSKLNDEGEWNGR